MNKKIALILACCAATSFAACNETTEWNFTESCDAEAKRCVESTIQVCKDGVWVLEATCEGNTPWCDVATHTCIAQPVVKDCKDGAQKCDQNAVWTCKTGKWEKTTDCNEGDKTCNSTTYVCDPKTQTEVTCDHNGTKLAVDATVCSDDTTLQTCTLNADGTTASLTPTDCSTDSKVCGNDAENKADCIDAQPAPSVKCTKDGDETEYKVGDKYCGDNNTLYTCTLSEDGTTATFESAACQGDKPVCDKTANDCRAYNNCTLNNAPVAHDALACDGNVSKKCNDGTLENVNNCATLEPAQVCLASTGACGVAPVTSCTDTVVGTVEDGKTVCKENNVYTCNNTQLSQTKACTVTADDTSKSFVATCIAANGDAAAHCDKKCAEDTALNEAGDACEPIDGKNIICRVNNNVAQVKRFWSGQFSEWNNCSDNQEAGTENAAEYGCNDAGDGCIVKSCVAGYHPVKGDNGKYTCEHDITMNCGTDADGKPFEINSYHCNDDNTKVMVCSAENSADYTATLQQTAVCDASKGFTCDPKKVGTLEACACTADTPTTCKLTAANVATLYTCNADTGEYKGEACPKHGTYSTPICNTDNNGCDYECKLDRVKNIEGTDCVKCTDPTATSCGEGKYCGADGKCKAVETTSCTADVCKNGFINYCKGNDGAKKYADAVSCIENGVGICAEGGTACTTRVKSCNVDYMLVENACKKYDTVECTTGVCTDSHYFGCPAVTDGTSYHTKGVEKPAVDANGTWACDVDNGWTLTCTDTDLYEVKDGKCVLKAGKCKADADCSGDTPKCDVASNTCVAATPAACEPKCEEVTDGSVKKVKVTTCSETGVATTNEYTDKSCKSATEVGVCLNDAKRCATGSTVGIETCANGEWGTAVACSSTDADAETFECVAEATCKIKTCKNDKTPSEDGLTCVAGGTPAPTKSLIISEVAKIENSNSPKHSLHFYEIYNATDSVANMDGCSINIYKSKNTIIDKSIPLDGSLNASSTYVVCYGGFDDSDAITQSLNTKCNSRMVDVSTTFSTKRVVELKCNEKTIDIIGKPGDENSVKQNNMIRNCSITKGISDEKLGFQASEWTTGTSTKDGLNASLGTHKAVCDTPTE